MNLYTRNIMALMSMSQSQSARFLRAHSEGRVERFLSFINLNIRFAVPLIEGEAAAAEKNCHDIFRYGWLNPDGEFVYVDFAQHEQTVERVTGYSDCDTACEAGWVKFTVGLPYNHMGECLFEPKSDKSLLSTKQASWLNEWLAKVAEGNKPTF